MAKKAKKGARPIVIRREEVVSGAHHGGAWKVAYADFVTAMMAFFLLMWLINATTEKQRRGLADYFSPIGPASRSMSGSGKPFGGLTPNESGSMVSNRGYVSNTDQTGRPPPNEQPTPETPPSNGREGGPSSGQAGDKGVSNQLGVAKFAAPQTDPDAIPIEGDSNQPGASGRADADQDADTDADRPATSPAPSVNASTADQPTDTRPDAKAQDDTVVQQRIAAAAQQRLADAAADIKRAINSDPAIGEAARQVAVDVTPDELRIQIFDAEGKPMFNAGAAVPNARAKRILAEIAPVLARLGEPISIVGHTDGAPCDGRCRSNWDLSAARADATRAALVAGGLSDGRIAGVAGLADHDLLLPSQPTAPANRRVVMIVHRRAPGIVGEPAGQ